MRLTLNVEIPQWTQWLAGGMAIGLIIGVGAARVYAGPITVRTDWQPGQVLKAEDLNNALKTLQDELNRQQGELSRLQNQDCPPGYAKEATATDIVLCKKGKDEVVKVGTGNTAFWVDRYEVSIWQNADGSGTQYGLADASEYPIAGFPENGQYATPLYALSVTGVQPSAYVTWFQAKAACRLSGKRLPDGEEWLEAALNTPDPGAHAGTGGLCVTSATGPRKTGEGTLCRSQWGAEDMVGNLWEMTDDWHVGISGEAGATSQWPEGESFHGDGTWNIASGASSTSDATVFYMGIPSRAGHGGCWGDGIRAGVFALALNSAPMRNTASSSFRCIIPR